MMKYLARYGNRLYGFIVGICTTFTIAVTLFITYAGFGSASDKANDENDK